MWTISTTTFWYPFYAILLVFIILKRKKDVWVTLLVIVLMIILSDQSADWVKDHVHRLRPTHHPSIAGLVHIVGGYRGGDYGFISSHASNAFAVAAFTSLFFARRWITILIMVWAALISYSRIYLGVHYPLDVLGGCISGLAAGSLMYCLDRWVVKAIHPTHR
jgi:undecaprenyl-diphosphatase